jgi:hypothetical protein
LRLNSACSEQHSRGIQPISITKVFRSLDKLIRLPLFVLIALCLISTSPPLARGQDSAMTATIAGSVRDAAGVIVLAATITLRNLTTNQTRRITSEADGSYRASALPVGDYEVRAEAAGFASYVNPNVTLALGRTTSLDI